MNTTFFIIGGILICLGFLVGVMKQTWLLSGFNEKRVSNKDRLSKLVGGYQFVMGIIFIGCGLLSIQSIDFLIIILVIGLIGLMTYTNIKLVDQ